MSVVVKDICCYLKNRVALASPKCSMIEGQQGAASLGASDVSLNTEGKCVVASPFPKGRESRQKHSRLGTKNVQQESEVPRGS